MPAAKHEFAKPASGKSTLVRPRFSPGLMLQDDDLTLAVDYMSNLSRLLFKSLFGCGVICGFKIGVSTNCGLQVMVKRGLALDCRGDPVQLQDEVTVSLADCERVDEHKALWVAIRRKEFQCSPRYAVCAPEEEDQGSTVSTRLRDGYEVRLFKKGELPKKCVCGCEAQEDENERHEAGTQAQPGADGNPNHPAANANAAPNQQAADAEDEPPIYATGDCYKDHYNGECSCDCCCEWVMLGRVYSLVENQATKWRVDYSERRFIRPVLARRPDWNDGA